MVVADLHVHTTNSDGELTLEAIPAAAREADLDAVAVTDHDRLHPDLSSPVVTRGDLTIVHGIELRVSSSAGRIDLLGYGARRTDALVAELDRLQKDRMERARTIAECVEDDLGVDLDLAVEPGVGRPHIARAIAESPADHGYQDAFDDLIGDDCPYYVQRKIPDFDTGRELLAEACGLVALAHPLRYDDPEAALALTDRLDGVERFYPYGRAVDTGPIDRAVEDHDLLVTGGSDAHGESLGLAGLDREAFGRVEAHLS